MKKYNIVLILLLLSSIMFGQNRSAIGTTNPDPSAAFEIKSILGGFLAPRLTTIQRNAIASPAVGLMIYNTTTNCYEFYQGSGWYNICWGGIASPNSPSSGGTAVVSSYNCSTASAGTMTAGTAVSGVTQTVTATVTTIGTYSISTVANGVTFSGSGTFAGTGAQNVVLTASGTPTVSGTDSFSLNTTPSCSFNRTTNANISGTSGGTAVVSSFNCSTASAGTMTSGVAVSGVTQTITATVTTVGTYSISTVANGVTFSGSGTFAGTGAQNIVLTASGTPTVAGSDSFVLSTTPGCSFNRTTNANISSTSGGTAVVSAFNCSTASAGSMTIGTAVSGVTQTITATVTTVGTYSISAVANGVTFSGSGAFAGTGAQDIVLTASGTPTASGSNSFILSTTPNCSFSRITAANVASVVGAAGETWMAYNLGATAVPSSATDYTQYGSLYQWGRGSDGHQLINWTAINAGTAANATTGTASTGDTPGNALYISTAANADWRTTANDNLWQGVTGINNPCPTGYRLPTDAEWVAEITASGITGVPSAYSSVLKLTASGLRSNTGAFFNGGGHGNYHSSTLVGALTRRRNFQAASAGTIDTGRSYGVSVRCIKD